MASTVQTYIDPDYGGADPAYYTSMSSAIADIFGAGGADITAATGTDEILKSECQCTGGTADSGNVTLTGITTASGNYLDIYEVKSGSYYHNGVYPTGNKYRIEASDSDVIDCRINHCRIRGLALGLTITANNTGYGIVFQVLSAGAEIYLSDINLKGTCAGTGSGYGIYVNDSDPDFYYFANVKVTNMVSGSDNGFRAYYDSGGTATIVQWNCMAFNNYYGFFQGAAECHNCISANNTDDFSGPDVIDYCASDDGDDTGVNGIDWNNEATDWAANFTAYGSDDFTVKDTNADIYQAGADQPAWFDTITGGTDIANNAWHATTPSIGCYEYAAGGGTSVSINDVSAPSSVTDLAITRLRSIAFNDVSAGSSITDEVITRSRQIGFTDISSASELTDIVATRMRAVGFTNVSAISQITDIVAGITSPGDIAFNNVSSLSEVTDIVLTRIRNIAFLTVEAASAITSLVLAGLAGGGIPPLYPLYPLIPLSAGRPV